MTLAQLQVLAREASPEAVELATRILEQDVVGHAWAAQVGPALTQRDTARLLSKSEQAVAKDGRLLRVRSQQGRPLYPVMQFGGRHQIPGVADVVAALRESLEPLSVASWLTVPNRDLGRRRPVDVVAAGEDGERVLLLARRLARAAA